MRIAIRSHPSKAANISRRLWPSILRTATSRFWAYSATLAAAIFSLLWATLVYDPVCHWVWGVGGWLRTMGALDFAGGTVVHINAGIAALVTAIIIGKRKNLRPVPPHNLAYTMIGASLLWFGWFGFNAGSALAANGLAGSAFLNTHVAAAAALVTWAIVETFHSGKPTVLGVASGAVAGLVAITPAAGFVEPWAAIVIGICAGTACYFGLFIKNRFKFDDALDVVGVHGVGGTTGAILTGVFATTAINAAGRNGLLYGNPQQVLIQLVGVVAAWAFSFCVSMVILKATDLAVGLRVDEETEVRGLDLGEHLEEGYILD